MKITIEYESGPRSIETNGDIQCAYIMKNGKVNVRISNNTPPYNKIEPLISGDADLGKVSKVIMEQDGVILKEISQIRDVIYSFATDPVEHNLLETLTIMVEGS